MDAASELLTNIPTFSDEWEGHSPLPKLQESEWLYQQRQVAYQLNLHNAVSILKSRSMVRCAVCGAPAAGGRKRLPLCLTHYEDYAYYLGCRMELKKDANHTFTRPAEVRAWSLRETFDRIRLPHVGGNGRKPGSLLQPVREDNPPVKFDTVRVSDPRLTLLLPRKVHRRIHPGPADEDEV